MLAEKMLPMTKKLLTLWITRRFKYLKKWRPSVENNA